MKQEIQSTIENITSRIKNPFIGAFVLCTLLQNWELIYTLFNFDTDCNLSDKVIIIRTYLNNNSGDGFCNWLFYFFINPAVYAFGLLVFYSLGRLVYTFILTLYFKHLEPFIIRLIQKGGYETIEKYIELEKLNSTFITTINNYKEKYRLLNKDYLDSISEYENLKIKNDETVETLTRFESLKEVLVKYKDEEAIASSIQISQVFTNQWLYISDIERDVREFFFIKDNQYIVDTRTVAQITECYFNKQKRLLSFKKEYLSNQFNTSRFYLIQQDSGNFIGIEDVTGISKIVKFQLKIEPFVPDIEQLLSNG